MTPSPLGNALRTLAESKIVTEEQRDLCVKYADEFDAQCVLYAEAFAPDTRKMLGCWARARRLYCEITGETPV